MTKDRPGTTVIRRRGLAGLGLAAFAPRLARAQDFPSRPVRIMVGATPGGSIDTGARIIAPRLAEALGTPIVVENKPGAAGVLCSDYVAKSTPDGYTLLIGTPSPVIVAPQAMTTIAFNPLTDVAAINMVSTSPIAIAVNPRLNVSNMAELVALSRTRPITIGLPLIGSVSHLVVEITGTATGCNFLNVPYAGASPAMNDAVAGHIDSTVADVGVLLPLHAAGRLRVVVVTSERRIEQLPDIEFAGEVSPAMVATNWMGFFAPARTPRPIIDRINAALGKVTARDDVKAQFQRLSVTASNLPNPDAFQSFVASEYLRYGQLVRERGIVISG